MPRNVEVIGKTECCPMGIIERRGRKHEVPTKNSGTSIKFNFLFNERKEYMNITLILFIIQIRSMAKKNLKERVLPVLHNHTPYMFYQSSSSYVSGNA